MKGSDRDYAYLWDILRAARELQDLAEGETFKSFTDDRKLQLASERLLEIVGEASRRLSTSFREQHTQIPWKEIVGLRNVLAHEYGDIWYESLWQVITDDLPGLLAFLEALRLEEAAE